MKIYLLPIDYPNISIKKKVFPQHSNGYNIETGFLNFLHQNPYLLTKNPDEADWHYLPIMWSFWQLSNNYGKDNREVMQNYLNEVILDDKKTFTISEADNEPGFEIGDTKVFSANQIIPPIIKK
jgi:hypothetical protein